MRKFLLLITAWCLGALMVAQAQEWTIVQTFEVPGKASGLASDGQYIYFGQYGTNGPQVNRLDPATGDYEFVCNGPMEDTYGLAWDGEYLWTTDHPAAYDPGIAFQFDLSGNVISQFECPATYMGGIEYDNGNFWLAAYYDPDGQIFLTDGEGNVLKDFPTPGTQPWDICLQDEFLWIADYNDNMIYKVDTISGSLIESHACENVKPAGITYDGQYLWYVDGPLSAPSTIYKVDLGGSGTPAINLPESHDFGNVALGDSAVWAMNVMNSGNAPLDVEGLVIGNSVPVYCYASFPVTIPAGENADIELVFRPTETGTLNTTMQVQSTDPINPEVDVELTGEAVISGPSIVLPTASHNYGNVRVNAFTRWFLEIKNIGDESLHISDMISDNPAFIVDENVSFPILLAPLETRQIGIWFNPEEGGDISGSIEISSDDPQNPAVTATFSGAGVIESYPIGQTLWQYTITGGYDNSPKAIIPISDITGDGIDDVVIGSEDDMIRCFNGNSDGTADLLWSYEIYAGNVYQQDNLTVLPDVDNDGYDDVVFGTAYGDRSVTALSGKTGAFLWKFDTHIWGEGGWVYQVDAKKDYNGDAIPDVLAVAGDDMYGTGPKRAFCVDGTDGSLIWDHQLGGPGFSVMSIDDVNGDDIPDVLAGASDQGEINGTVTCISGDNGAQIWTKTTDGSSVWGLVTIDDINEDGINDVAVGDFGGYYYAFDPTNGDELFSSGMGGGDIILRLERLDDVNDDGFADILVASSSTNCIVVDGYDGSTIWLNALADKAWNVDRMSDISGDGINDVIVGTLYSNNYVYFLDGTTGEELKSMPMSAPVDAIAAIPDIDGDHSMEMVAGDRQGGVFCYSGGLDAWTSVPGPVVQKGLQVECTPNPFVDHMTISLQSTDEMQVQVQVLSAGGRLIRDLGDFRLDESRTEISWNGTDLRGNNLRHGLYLLTVSNGRYTKTIKLIRQ